MIADALLWLKSTETSFSSVTFRIFLSFVLEAENKLKDIIEITNEKLVSIDFNHNKASSVVDGSLTNVVGDNMGKISAWYDNEWGFSNRMCDIANYLHKKFS